MHSGQDEVVCLSEKWADMKLVPQMSPTGAREAMHHPTLPRPAKTSLQLVSFVLWRLQATWSRFRYHSWRSPIRSSSSLAVTAS